MAAKQAAPADRAPIGTERTGRFDAIRFDKGFAQVNVPGYDFKRAVEKTRPRRAAPPAAASPAPAAAHQPQESIEFRDSAIPARQSAQPPPDDPGFEIQL